MLELFAARRALVVADAALMRLLAVGVHD